MELPQLSDYLRGKVVIVGVGNPLKGDDGFGPYMIEQLQGRVSAVLFDCGTVPENFIGPIGRQRPDVVLVLDAADFSAPPGQLIVLGADQWRGGGFSSHSLSLKLFADILTKETAASIFLVAVQPKQVGLGQPISQEVKEGCAELQQWLETTLSPEC
jgi:hydrogenase 3 maturation protease